MAAKAVLDTTQGVDAIDGISDVVRTGASIVHDPGNPRPVVTQADLEAQSQPAPIQETAAEAQTTASPEAAPQGGEELPPHEAFAQKLLEKLAEREQSKQQGETAEAKGAEELSRQAQLEQQRDQLQTDYAARQAEFEAKMAELDQQYEGGDLDQTRYNREYAMLARQQAQHEAQFGKEVGILEMRLEQIEEQANTQIRSAREQFVQQHPDFIDYYQNRHQQNPIMDPVGGYFAEKFQAASSENEQLKAKIAEMERTVASAQPGKVMAGQGAATLDGSGKMLAGKYPSGPMGTYQRLVDQGLIPA